MRPYSKYDPEDIESLLLHKQFHELYPEEKEFILQHIETPEEYESLRKTLFELRDAAANDQWLQPDASLKKELMAQFVTEEKGGFRVWLNSLFTWPDVQWYRQPSLRLAFAGACVAALVVVIVNLNNDSQPVVFADNKVQQVEKEKNLESAPEEKEEKNLFAENLSAQELPAAPKVSTEPTITLDMPTEVAMNDVADAEMAPPAMEEKSAPPPAVNHGSSAGNTDDVSTLKEDVVETTSTTFTDAAKSVNAGKVVTTNAYKNITKKDNAVSQSRPVSEVNDLLNYLFTAQ